MDLHNKSKKFNTVLPINNKKIEHEKETKKKPKHSNKLNISDFLPDRKKKLSKKFSQKFNFDFIEENKKIPTKNYFNRRASFMNVAHIKQVLLKDYKDEIKKEKKFRKLKIIENLSDSEDESDEEEQNAELELYISSESNFILIFDIILTLFTFYFLFFVPVNLIERKKNYYVEEKLIYTILNIIVEVLYILDLLICFFRTFYNYEYKMVTETNKIIQNYLSNDFFLDLLEAFPSYIISKKICNKDDSVNDELSGFEIMLTIFQMIKSFKIIKVLGSGKNRAIEILTEKISDNYFLDQLLNILMFGVKIFSFLHLLICIHIFLGMQSNPNWMTYINIIDEKLITKYICSFYFIIETMTTVGYGDVLCISFIETIFQLILLSIGIVSYSFVVTKFGNYVMNQSKEEIELDKKILQLEQIRIQYPLMPYKLYINIQNYFRKKSEKKSNKNEIRNLINILPDKLRNEMLLITYQYEIKNFFVFKGCKNTDFIIQMCSAFIHSICEKETILIMEGKTVENIIFVKEGRLILEATINLSNPKESYEKYFRQNFKFIDQKALQKMRSSISQTDGFVEPMPVENNNYLHYLEKKLIDNNKIGKKGNSFFDVTKNSISFQEGYGNEEDHQKNKKNEGEKSDIEATKEKPNFNYLKILDIRKNEHFGDINLFMDKPAPLTLKVKSKHAQIYILKKKDALNINSIHHNIMKRIGEKSFKNLVSIKNKTFHLLKKYIGNKLNKIKRTQLQNTSWFNEKTLNNIMQDNTHFLNNSINQVGDASPIEIVSHKNLLDYLKLGTKQKSSIDYNNKDHNNSYLRKMPMPFSSVNVNANNIIRFKNILSGYRKSEEALKHNINNNNLLSLNYEPNINKSKDINKSLNLNKINIQSFKNDKIFNDTQRINLRKSNTKSSSNLKIYKSSKIKLAEQKTKSLSKSFKSSRSNNNGSFSEISSELTEEEEEDIKSLNKVHTDQEINSKRKNKSYEEAQKGKILNLCKMQTKMIKLYEKKMNEKSSSNNTNINFKEITDEFKKISDLNNVIYNKIMEYLETEADTDNEAEKNSLNKNNKNEYNPVQTISFTIKSSYSNINNLTKGKIVINNNYKIDIKNLIQNYIKLRNKNTIKSIDSFVKKYYRDYKENEDRISNNDFTPKKRVKFKLPQSSRNHLNYSDEKNGKDPTKFLSYKIKKTITNKIQSYKNFKNLDFNHDKSQKNIRSVKSKIFLSPKSILTDNKENTNANTPSGFSKFLNSIFSKFKGK